MRRIVELVAIGIAVAGCAQILGFESPTLDESAGPSAGGAGGAGQGAGPGGSAAGPGGGGGGAGNTGNVGNGGNGGNEGGTGGVGAFGGGATEIDLPVASTTNDAVWNQTNTSPDELLFDGTEDLYVSTDSFDSTAGFRFQLPIPPGATIVSATLEVTTGAGDLDGSQNIQIQVWDSVDVPPFDGAHTHHPMAHDPAGLWATSVDGFAPLPGTIATSPNLSGLVQHIVDRPDYDPNDWIGFVLLPGAGMGVGHWITLLDYVSGTPAVLHVIYVE